MNSLNSSEIIHSHSIKLGENKSSFKIIYQLICDLYLICILMGRWGCGGWGGGGVGGGGVGGGRLVMQ